MLLEDSEQEPLLSDPQAEQQKPEQQRTPLPKLQLAVVLLVQVTERISGQVIAPFINQVSEFHSP